MKFSELNLHEDILEGLDAMNFEKCTEVQEKAIPEILKGHDIIAIAQTGTGKTAAFVLPILHKLGEDNDSKGIRCIIMSPTRELAQQIDQELQGFAYFSSISSVPVYGGNDSAAFEQQKRGLTQGADIVIATPGRLLSHINLGYVDLSNLSIFVLDEADRMLDMGFHEDIMTIEKLLPKKRQTLLFSATMPPKIQTLSHTILNNPIEIKLAVSKPAEKILQAAYVCYENQKIEIIKDLFKNEQPKRTLIFTSTKNKVREIAQTLNQLNLKATEMHSDLDQNQREKNIRDFKSGFIQLLVATDIVSRGIDIEDIRLVINYDVPNDVEDYVHRIGRTARANNDGVALTFIGYEEQNDFHQIEVFLEKEIFKIPLPSSVGEGPDYNPQKRQTKRTQRRDTQKKKGVQQRRNKASSRKQNRKD
ncbi:MAG: DEAD/DEAH box helicase [Bacteroidales bacterium]|nr:DEAD/DEAH box helicase [Bacteroidales bacterium]